MTAQTNKTYRFVTALIERGERHLITQRCTPDGLVGLWEFPGGKVEPGETEETTLQRVLSERLGIEVRVGQVKARRTRQYLGYAVESSLHEVRIVPAGQLLRALTVADFRWVTATELEQYPFVPADQASTDALLGIRREFHKGAHATPAETEWLRLRRPET